MLRAQGEDEAARIIAIAEQFLAPKKWYARPWRFLFGRFFGFGLLPLRALGTLSLYLFLGAVGVYFAQRHGYLVESSIMTTSYFKTERATTEGVKPEPITTFITEPTRTERSDSDRIARSGQQHTKVFLSIDGLNNSSQKDILCADAATNPVADIIYAADMIVPFIPLDRSAKSLPRKVG